MNCYCSAVDNKMFVVAEAARQRNPDMPLHDSTVDTVISGTPSCGVYSYYCVNSCLDFLYNLPTHYFCPPNSLSCVHVSV